jgi:hypothetical protein
MIDYHAGGNLMGVYGEGLSNAPNRARPGRANEFPLPFKRRDRVPTGIKSVEDNIRYTSPLSQSIVLPLAQGQWRGAKLMKWKRH